MEAKSIDAETRLWFYPNVLGTWLFLSRYGYVQQLAAAVIHITMAATVIFRASQAGERRRFSRSAAIHGGALVVRLEIVFGCHCYFDARLLKVRLPEMISAPLDSFGASPQANGGLRK